MGGEVRTTVIGSGRMAPGIAAACADAGLNVRVAARDAERGEEAARLAMGFSSSGATVESADISAAAVEDAELVIETIVEDADVKRDLFVRLEGWVGGDTVIATNTSSFSITSLADGLAAPERFAGFHFLNPAHETAVVEVIAGERTGERAVGLLTGVAERMGKAPLIVQRDVPGFIWNRLQLAVLRECLYLLDEGVADIASIDSAVADGLAPRWVGSGPFATADLGGINTWATVATQLFQVLSNERGLPAALGERAAADRAFYSWTPESEREVGALRARSLRENLRLIEARRLAMPPAVELSP